MTKQEAVSTFGNNVALAAALGVTKQAITAWPAILDLARADRVRGAALRLGKRIPAIGEVAA